MPPRTRKKAKSKGKEIHTPPSVLGSRKKKLSRQLAEKSSETVSSVPPCTTMEGESSKAVGTGRNAKNYGQGALYADTRRATTRTHRRDTPNIVEGNHEAVGGNMKESSGILNNANNVVLTNPTMVDNSTCIINHVAGDKEVRAKELLSKHIIQGAAHNSSARDPPPQCHPGTRISINKQIMVWFYDEEKRELILWIYGPAGVGKSAIVQTTAEALAGKGCLGASVFFSRPNGRNNSRSVFITIAYQLAVHIPAYCAFISEKFASDPELVNTGVKEQFKTFIVEPFVEKEIGAGGKTWDILLDGLDELDEKHWQREIIRLVTAFVLEHPNVPLAWVISSRPESHISDTFKEKQRVSSFREEFIPVDSPEACQDVERYLRSSFERIREEFPRIVSEGWPEEIKFTTLAHAASGLFAFADVAVRYIGDAKYADPITRLDDVLAVIKHSRVDCGDEQPFAHLDALYMRILASIPRKTWPVTQQVLVVIRRLPFPKLHCTKGLSVILGIELSKIYTAINDLYSILNISLDDVFSGMYFHHASFTDFLGEATRSKEFYTPFEDMQWDILERCVRIWLDFRKQSPRGPNYKDRWNKYALQFHSDVNVPVDVSQSFNESLLNGIDTVLRVSLLRKRALALKETSQKHWDEVVEILCRVDADSLHRGLLSCEEVATFWSDVWKIRHKELSDAGIIYEIRLEQLQFYHLWLLEWYKCHTREVFDRHSSKRVHSYSPWEGNRTKLSEYISGFKYFQQHNPTLPVLICGTRGSRFAVFMYDYSEEDFKLRPLHTGIRGELEFKLR